MSEISNKMITIPIDALLEPASEEHPAGEDLEYDPAFIELEEAARGKEERQMGDLIEAAEEPDWKDVAARCIELFERTKDLRIAVYLTRATLALDGLAGLAKGLQVIDGLLDRYWEEMHPQLDPDDDYDPVMRVNILAELIDPENFLGCLRTVPLVTSRTFGSFSFRDIAIAKGALLPIDDEELVDLAHIEGAFAEVGLDELQVAVGVVAAALEALNRIEGRVTEKVGVEQTVSLDALSGLLLEIYQLLEGRLPGDEERALQDGDEQAGGAMREHVNGLSGVISSRDEVIVALEKIAEYYLRYEPSSPLPLLMNRAKSLVHADFLEIIRNIAPEAMPQARSVAGPDSSEQNE